MDDVKPRENVFTFNAWKALGRSVKKGEHGVKVVVFVEMSGEVRDPSTGETERKGFRAPRTTTVFHISQTEATTEAESRWQARRAEKEAKRAANKARHAKLQARKPQAAAIEAAIADTSHGGIKRREHDAPDGGKVVSFAMYVPPGYQAVAPELDRDDA